MGLFGIMRTGVSGMNAQSSKLGTVADNIANSSTTGYKRASSEFSSMVFSNGKGSYNSGGVEASTRYAISEQGNLSFTTSTLDIAIDGNGFFVVADADGTPALTRAGSFVPDGDGFLLNTAGYYLQGYPVANGSAPSVVANGLGGLEPINIQQNQLQAAATDAGNLFANLPDDAAIVVPADLPSINAATATPTEKTSMVGYDNLGNEMLLDVYFTKSAETPGVDASWEVAVFDAADAAAGGGFPYATGALANATLVFDLAAVPAGSLTGASPTDITFTIPGGQATTINLSEMTQLGADFTITRAETNGNAPSPVEDVEFGDDGTLFAVYANGDRRAIYRIPLADVPSPDRLSPVSGNIYTVTLDSGDVRVGFPGEGGLGDLKVGALESSNVDLASELTSMIESQRTYTANSKVFQTGSDLLNELVNMTR